MKTFLSKDDFIHLRTLYLLVFLFGLLEYLFFATSGSEIPSPFDLFSLVWTSLILGVSSITDPKKYFNLGTLLGLGSFFYILFHFIHNASISLQ